MHHVDGGHQDEGEDEVSEGAGESDQHALPAGMVVQIAGVAGGLFAGDLAGHFDVSAKRQRIDLIVGSTAAETDDALAETDGEGLDADAAPLGHGEVAKLVHQDHQAEHQKKLKDSGHKSVRILVLPPGSYPAAGLISYLDRVEYHGHVLLSCCRLQTDSVRCERLRRGAR